MMNRLAIEMHPNTLQMFVGRFAKVKPQQTQTSILLIWLVDRQAPLNTPTLYFILYTD